MTTEAGPAIGVDERGLDCEPCRVRGVTTNMGTEPPATAIFRFSTLSLFARKGCGRDSVGDEGGVVMDMNLKRRLIYSDTVCGTFAFPLSCFAVLVNFFASIF